jgi:hypothetical protein
MITDQETVERTIDELTAWLSSGLRLQQPRGSVLHQLLEDWRSSRLVCPTHLLLDKSFDYVAHYRRLFDHRFHVFLIEHDWAAAFANSNMLGDPTQSIEFRPPYDHTCHEFLISGKRVCFIAHFIEDERYEFCAFVRTSFGWIQPPLKRPSLAAPLHRLLGDQFQAIAIALDAKVAETEIVRAPERLNRVREKRGRLPTFDYHILNLAHRSRPSSLPPEQDSMRNSPRLHFRRGHWRHFETFKTWINWMLVGDPDLGFIDKHYRL